MSIDCICKCPIPSGTYKRPIRPYLVISQFVKYLIEYENVPYLVKYVNVQYLIEYINVHVNSIEIVGGVKVNKRFVAEIRSVDVFTSISFQRLKVRAAKYKKEKRVNLLPA